MRVPRSRSSRSSRQAPGWRPRLLLSAGAAFGILLAALGLRSPDGSADGGLPPGSVARVNDVLISAADFERALAALAQDRRSPPGPEDRQRVLDRLVDEELLVQRGLELGLARHDSRVRKDLSAAVIDAVVAEFADYQPDDDELERYYRAHRDYFAQAGRLRVRQVWIPRLPDGDGAAAEARAREAARRLRAGVPLESVRAELGEAEPAPLPDALMPVGKLRDYLGATAVRALLAGPSGGVTDPVAATTGFHVLQVVEAEPPQVPPLGEIRAQVAAEIRRRKAEEALRAYLDGLRAGARVVVREPPR